MERFKQPREKKVRVNISIDESVYMEYGLYIDNLSAFLNKTLKNYIKNAKEQQNNNNESDSTRYVKKDRTIVGAIIEQIMRDRNINYLEAYNVYLKEKEKANPRNEDLPF